MTALTNHATRWTEQELEFLTESWDGTEETLSAVAELRGRAARADGGGLPSALLRVDLGKGHRRRSQAASVRQQQKLKPCSSDPHRQAGPGAGQAVL